METIDSKLYRELLAVTTTKGTDMEGESPLRAATASPYPYAVGGETIVMEEPLLDSSSRPSNVTISSILRLSIQGHSAPRRRISMTDWSETPRAGACASPTERARTGGDDNNRNVLLMPTGPLSNTHMLANDESAPKVISTREEGERGMRMAEMEREAPLPLKLFRLSLESPSVSRPSIELPPTLSRMPSAKKSSRLGGPKFSSSQDSIFVAGTQFPSTCHGPGSGRRNRGTLPRDDDNMAHGHPMNLGAISSPALEFTSMGTTFARSNGTIPLSPLSAPVPAPSSSTIEIPPTQWPVMTIECSQAMDLFAADTEKSATDSELTEILFLSPPPLLPQRVTAAHMPKVSEGEAATRVQTSTVKEDNPFLEEVPNESLAPITAIIEERTMSAVTRPSARGESESRRRVQFADFTRSETSSETDAPSVSTVGGGRTGRRLPGTIIGHGGRGTGGSFHDGNTRKRSLSPATPAKGILPRSSVVRKCESNRLARFPISTSTCRDQGHVQPVLAEAPLSDVSGSSGDWHRTLSQDGDPSCGLPSASPTIISRVGAHEPLSAHPSKLPLLTPQSSLASPGLTAAGLSLGEHMLVWARWRYQYYAPAILQSRTSRTRDLWRVRFAHWRGPRTDEAASTITGAGGRRSVCLATDQMSPMTGELAKGQPVWIVRNRRKMQLTEGQFVQWHGPGRMEVAIGEAPGGDSYRGEIVDLQRILIDRLTFMQVRARGAASGLPSATSSQSIGSGSGTGSGPLPEPPSSQAPPPSSTSRVVSLDKRTRSKPRRTHKNGGILKGYTFLISLGGGLSETAKRTQKSHLISRIKDLGGAILEAPSSRESRALSFPLSTSPSPSPSYEKDHSRTILLVNGYYRLAKIYLALVMDIRIVRLEWLEACERARSLPSLAAFAIPIPGNRPVDTSTRCRLLSNWQIAVEGSTKFKASWIPVCEAAGATICLTYCGEGSMRILVESLPSATSRLARFAKETGIIVVTVDWLMQSILSGRVF